MRPLAGKCRRSQELVLELRGQIATLETKLDTAVDAAWEA